MGNASDQTISLSKTNCWRYRGIIIQHPIPNAFSEWAPLISYPTRSPTNTQDLILTTTATNQLSYYPQPSPNSQARPALSRIKIKSAQNSPWRNKFRIGLQCHVRSRFRNPRTRDDTSLNGTISRCEVSRQNALNILLLLRETGPTFLAVPIYRQFQFNHPLFKLSRLSTCVSFRPFLPC